MKKKKCNLCCPVCNKVFKSHETADNHAARKDHWGDYEPVSELKKKPKIEETGFGVMVDSKCRDSKGEPIYFPKVGSHYDRALQKTFHSKKEKSEYLKTNNLCMDGSTDLKRRPIEAGDERFSRVR